MLRLMKTASDLKYGCVRFLSPGLTLQKRRRGMKTSLVRARRRVRREPALLEPGHLTRPATIRPARSPRLKIRNPPIGTKNSVQVWWIIINLFRKSELCDLITAGGFGQTEVGGEHSEGHEEVEEGSEVEEPGWTEKVPQVDLFDLFTSSRVLLLGVGPVEVLPGGVPEEHHHRGEEDSWAAVSQVLNYHTDRSPAKLKEKRAAVVTSPPTARKLTEIREAIVPPMA